MSDDDSDGMGGMTFTDSLEFWGLEVPPNKNMTVQFDPQDDEELIHITQARAQGAGQRGGGRALCDGCWLCSSARTAPRRDAQAAARLRCQPPVATSRGVHVRCAAS